MNNYNEYFDSRKPTAFGANVLAWWHRRMLAITTKIIPDFQKKQLLEIGAAHGFFADACQRYGMNYRGHEMNELQADALQQQGFKVTPATIPPIPAGEAAQVIWLSHVLEHAKSYVRAKEMLEACHERLDPNGYLVIIAPDIHHWKSEFWSCDWSHGFPTSLNRVEQLLSETGFDLHHSTHHTFTVTNSFLAWLLSFIFRITLPITLIDFFSKKWTGRTFGNSFMGVFGLRQIYLIGHKK